jgi:hypothetical protein
MGSNEIKKEIRLMPGFGAQSGNVAEKPASADIYAFCNSCDAFLQAEGVEGRHGCLRERTVRGLKQTEQVADGICLYATKFDERGQMTKSGFDSYKSLLES